MSQCFSVWMIWLSIPLVRRSKEFCSLFKIIGTTWKKKGLEVGSFLIYWKALKDNAVFYEMYDNLTVRSTSVYEYWLDFHCSSFSYSWESGTQSVASMVLYGRICSRGNVLQQLIFCNSASWRAFQFFNLQFLIHL